LRQESVDKAPRLIDSLSAAIGRPGIGVVDFGKLALLSLIAQCFSPVCCRLLTVQQAKSTFQGGKIKANGTWEICEILHNECNQKHATLAPADRYNSGDFSFSLLDETGSGRNS